MTNSTLNRPMKRKLLKLLALLPLTAGCSVAAHTPEEVGDPQKRFKGIGLVLVVDAVPGAELRGVVLYDDRGVQIFASSLVARRNRAVMALSSARIPLTVRILWRDNPKPVWGKQGGIDYEGAIIGDYTIPIAERTPNEILADIRAHGGALRLKFRLKPDGILFGWDIQRRAPLGDVSIFELPGGDFLETRY